MTTREVQLKDRSAAVTLTGGKGAITHDFGFITFNVQGHNTTVRFTLKNSAADTYVFICETTYVAATLGILHAATTLPALLDVLKSLNATLEEAPALSASGKLIGAPLRPQGVLATPHAFTEYASNTFIERGKDDSLSLYINGDLQFDSKDERRYHEFLVRPAMARVAQTTPEGPLNVLILGGGDGLALREVLAYDRVAAATLVDIDGEVVMLGRTELSTLNAKAFDDPRADIQVADALQYVKSAVSEHKMFDVIICDFTVPNDLDSVELFGKAWFSNLAKMLKPGGALATNGASPTHAPEAFWAIHNTLKAVGLDVRPMHINIPSFAQHGYGEWSFFLAGQRLGDLRKLAIVPGEFITPAILAQSFLLPRSIALLAPGAPVIDGNHPEFLRALHQPRHQTSLTEETGPLLDFASQGLEVPLSSPEAASASVGALTAALQAAMPVGAPVDVSRALSQLPAQHRDHTRSVVSEFASDPGAFLEHIDVPKLLDATLARLSNAPKSLLVEVEKVRDSLGKGMKPRNMLSFGGKVMTALFLVLLVSNLLAPDAAYAKGPGGGTVSGHGFSSNPARVSSIKVTPPAGGKGPVITAPVARTPASGSLARNAVSTYAKSPAFKSTTARPMTDVYGSTYPARSFYHYGSPYGIYSPFSPYWYLYHGHGSNNAAPPLQQPGGGGESGGGGATGSSEGAFFLTTDAAVLANGGTVVTLGDKHYLQVGQDALFLADPAGGAPAFAFYKDPAVTNHLREELTAQIEQVDELVDTMQMSVHGLRAYEKQADGLAALHANLNDARSKLGTSAAPVELPTTMKDAQPIFAGAWALPSGVVALHNADGSFAYMRGNSLYTYQGKDEVNGTAPAALKEAVLTAINRSQAANTADLKAYDADLAAINKELAEANKDMAWYAQNIRDNGPGDVVEWGTQKMPSKAALEAQTKYVNELTQQRDEWQAARTKVADTFAAFKAVLEVAK